MRPHVCCFFFRSFRLCHSKQLPLSFWHGPWVCVPSLSRHMQAGDWQIGSVLDSNAFGRDPTPPTRMAAPAMKDDSGGNDVVKDGLGCGGGGGGVEGRGGGGGCWHKEVPALHPPPNSQQLVAFVFFVMFVVFFFHPSGFSRWLISPEICFNRVRHAN